jgi:hypothetical protein
MSFCRPSTIYKRRKSLSSPCKSSTLSQSIPSSSSQGDIVLVSDAPRTKRPRLSSSLFLPGPENLIALPGGITLTQESKPHKRISDAPTYTRSSKLISNDPFIVTLEDPAASESLTMTDNTRLTRTHRARKMERQRSKWIDDVIPSILLPYLRLLCDTDSLRLHPNLVPVTCSCESV